ncbi:hypothetical protein VdG1_08589 [Verticillium dahliae VDG1]|nr:hypothetical protein VdG1_08589 [Verticillium dahliae VDG1]
MSNREGAVGLPFSFCGRGAELQKTPLGIEMCAKGENCQAVGTIVYNNPSAFNIKTRSKSLKHRRTGTGNKLVTIEAENNYVPEKLKDPMDLSRHQVPGGTCGATRLSVGAKDYEKGQDFFTLLITS